MTHIVQLITAKNFEGALEALAAEPSLITATALNDPDREGVFHYAACSGNLDFMKKLIRLGGDLDRAAASRFYGTPLGEAARVGDIRIIELLHTNGARVDGADLSAMSPLMVAAKEAMPSAVGLLLSLGADPNRLSFIQRFLPLDFANWRDSEECHSLIRAANGISVTNNYDWPGQPGYGIVVTVSNDIGAVFPLQFAESKGSTSIRLAQVREKPRAMYLFSDDLHSFGRIELAFYLAPDWGVLAHYKDGMSKQSFPIDVLRILGRLVMQGLLVVQEGDVFKKANSPISHLMWPDELCALVVINHKSKNKLLVDELPENSKDCVELLVLAPLRQDGTWSKGPQYLKKTIESLREARLTKMMLVQLK
jgi:hypothetical protein